MALNDTLSIDIARRGTIHIPAKQADHGYDIVCTILRNGENIVDASTDTATFRVGKPDNTIYYGDATVNADNTVTIHVDDDGQMLAVPGFVVVDVTLNDGNGAVKSTQNFVLDVQAAPGGEAIPSWSVFIELEELVAEAREAIPAVPAAVEAANAAAENANAAAQHSVRFDRPQTLTYTQQEQARENINAAAPDGSYGGMTVGYAEQLTSSIVETDEVPYLFRTAGGNAEIGNYEEETIVGGSVAWNQMVQNGDFSDGTNGWAPENPTFASASVTDGIMSITASQNPQYFYSIGLRMSSVRATTGHKYYLSAKVKSPVSIRFGMRSTPFYTGTMILFATAVENTWVKGEVVFNANGIGGNTRPYFAPYSHEDFSQGDVIQYSDIMLFDLTQMFGTTIADYVYSLEQANAGSGISWLKSHGFFTEDYYPYTEKPVMKHVSGLVSHDMVGFNAWDEEWEAGAISVSTGENTTSTNTIRSTNYIRVIPNAQYFVTSPVTPVFLTYDKDKEFIERIHSAAGTLNIPADAYYIRFYVGGSATPITTYNHDICIHLHWDGERDGEYEAYRKESYALDSTVDLMGVLMLDASNNLYYDGDIYPSSGEGTSRFDIVDLGTLDWQASSNANCFYVRLTQAQLYALGNQGGMQCTKYVFDGFRGSAPYYGDDKTIRAFWRNAQTAVAELYVHDSAYTTAADFKAAMSGEYLVYEKQTPTSFSAAPYTNPQWVDNWGTEEYVVTPDADEFVMPVGHSTDYPVDLKAKLEATANNPQTDGIYLLQYQNGEATYTPLASDSTITDILARLTALENAQTQEG